MDNSTTSRPSSLLSRLQKAAAERQENAGVESTDDTICLSALDAALPPGLSPAESSPPGLPPGLTTMTQQALQQQPSVIPKSDTFGVAVIEDQHADFMTQKEKDIVAHLQIGQLRTDRPAVDDYYYRAVSRKSGERGDLDDTLKPLYFPALDTRRRPMKAITEFTVEGSLGKVSKSSHHRPRTQFQPPPTAPAVLAKDLSNSAFAVKGIVEQVFRGLIAIEDATASLIDDVEETPERQRHDHADIASAQDEIVQALGLGGSVPFDAAAKYNLSQILVLPKGSKAVGRALKAVSHEAALTLAGRIFTVLPLLEHCIVAGTGSAMDAFIADVLVPLVSVVGRSDWREVFGLFRALLGHNSATLSPTISSSIGWLLAGKVGLVSACMLLSRLECLKESMSLSEDTIEQLELSESCEHLCDVILHDRLPTLLSNNPGRSGATEHDHYAWQFLALLAVNIDGERKRSMVMELRDKILAVVGEGSTKSVKSMNVFLNALGLDASQLQ